MSRLRLISPAHHAPLLRARLHREEGASLIEFAFSLGIFLAATIGILILCMALFSYEYVDFASREAVRWAAVRGSQCINMPTCGANQAAITTYVQGLNYPIINPNNLTVTATWLQATFNQNNTPPTTTWAACASQCNAPGNEVRVTISYPFSFGIPFVGNFAPTVSSTSQMVISQ